MTGVPFVFEVTDKTGRTVHLSKERWTHITQEHPLVSDQEEIRETLIHPLKITPSRYDPEKVRYFYRYKKEVREYLFVAVKYLNGNGFVITAYYVRNIR